MTANTKLQNEYSPEAIKQNKHITLLAFVSLLLSVSLLLALFIIYKYNGEPSITKNADNLTPSNQQKTSMKSRQILPSSITPAPSENAASVLSYNPARPTINKNATENINMLIDTGINKIVGAEFTLKYNPKTIEIVSISPAGFLDKPYVLMNNNDLNSGTVKYAIGSMTPRMGNGNLITLEVKGLSAGASEISFNDTVLVAKDETGNVLKTSTNALISVIK